MNEAINAFRTAAPASEDWFRSAPARLDVAGIDRLPSDDWPQLYLREREIPWALNGQGMLVIALLSLAILLAFAPRGRLRPNGQMFFLGAGFMLLETKGVVHMALLFGCTWVVNSIVFFAILVMILCANLFVHGGEAAEAAAVLRAAGRGAAGQRAGADERLPVAARRSTRVVALVPGGVRAGLLRRRDLRHARSATAGSPTSTSARTSAGIILGGLSEHLSLVLGFNHLLLVAIAYYLLSLALRPPPAMTRAGGSSAPARLRTAAVGLGWVSQNRHLPAMQRNPAFDVVGVVDRHPDRAREVAARAGLRRHHAGERLAEVPWLAEVEAFVIGAAPASHGTLIREALCSTGTC